jgi:serine/threonine-protein kinase
MRWYPSDDSAVGAIAYKGTGCETAMFTADKGDKTTFGGGDDLPVNCVTFAQAVAVCHFRGMRLLTEVEWHYVASGRGQQRTYPWGEGAPSTCTQAIFGLDLGGANKCGFPLPVLTAAGDVSRDGVHDLAGSLTEWTFSTEGPYVAPEILPDDYAGATRTDDAITTRGGRFPSPPAELATTFSLTRDAKTGYVDVGFRCAKTVF